MIEQVSFTGEYKTSQGHIVTINSDRVFRVGQIIESGGKRYRIKGFPIPTGATPGSISMVVSEVNS